MQKFLTDVKVYGNVETDALKLGGINYTVPFEVPADSTATIASIEWLESGGLHLHDPRTDSTSGTKIKIGDDDTARILEVTAATTATFNGATTFTAAPTITTAGTADDNAATVKQVNDAQAAAETFATNAVNALTADGGAITALTGRVQTAEGDIDNLEKSLSDLEGAVVKSITGGSSADSKVTVSAGALAEDGSVALTVTTSDIASATDLTALETKVNSHIADAAKISIVVAEADAEGKPAVADPSYGKIYLVSNDAESGTYVEWIYVATAEDEEGKPTAGAWEKIGTTATDLSEYAKAADVEATYVAKNSLVSTDATGAGITISQSAGNVTGVSVAAGSVAENDANVVTGGTVHAAIEGVKTDVIDPLAQRVTTAEGEIDALQTATGTTLPGQISQTLTDAKAYTDQEVGKVSVEKGTGINVTADGKAFTVAVDTSTIATVQSVTDAVGAINVSIDTGSTNYLAVSETTADKFAISAKVDVENGLASHSAVEALAEAIENIEGAVTTFTTTVANTAFATTEADGVSKSVTIAHGLNVESVVVQVKNSAKEVCYPKVVVVDANNIKLVVSPSAAAVEDTYTVVVQK